MSLTSPHAIDHWVNQAFTPIAHFLNTCVFYSVSIGSTQIPLILIWLVFAGIFFTCYFKFFNIHGLRHAVLLTSGKYLDRSTPGQTTPFQALATAISGTVGIGNIGGVAIAISIGGPGAAFWMFVAGLLAMSTKLVECTLAVKYRRNNADGSVSGGPMYFLKKGIAKKGWPKFGKYLAGFYAIGIILAAFGGGNMFQANQAYLELSDVFGKQFFLQDGWMFGLIVAIIVATIIVGGIKSISKITSKVVPFMACTYVLSCLIILFINHAEISAAFKLIFTGAFGMHSMTGGLIGAIVAGFQRATFSSEAGIGSAAIAHASVKTDHPITEGIVALLEPFIGTVIICSFTALVVISGIFVNHPHLASAGFSGITLTSHAFSAAIHWASYPLAIAIMIFALSTLIAWSYYGLKGWTYLFGEKRYTKLIFQAIFCLFIIIGCSLKMHAVIEFADALFFLIALPNIFGLYMLASEVKDELNIYWQKIKLTK